MDGINQVAQSPQPKAAEKDADFEMTIKVRASGEKLASRVLMAGCVLGVVAGIAAARWLTPDHAMVRAAAVGAEAAASEIVAAEESDQRRPRRASGAPSE